jgi:hypothetical protein
MYGFCGVFQFRNELGIGDVELFVIFDSKAMGAMVVYSYNGLFYCFVDTI